MWVVSLRSISVVLDLDLQPVPGCQSQRNGRTEQGIAEGPLTTVLLSHALLVVTLVGPEGLEPSTIGLKVRCSTN